MTRLGLSNTDVVNASTQQLTHKMVAKGRKGRRLTDSAQKKIPIAIQALKPAEKLAKKDLFNY